MARPAVVIYAPWTAVPRAGRLSILPGFWLLLTFEMEDHAFLGVLHRPTDDAMVSMWGTGWHAPEGPELGGKFVQLRGRAL